MSARILIIEDNYVVRKNLKELLEESDYEVLTASDGNEGISAINEKKPDLILCDVMLPGIDGFQILESLNSLEFFLKPFIFLTAKSDMHDLRKGMTLGADDYIIKPYRSTELLSVIKNRLNKYEMLAERKRNEEINESELDMDDKIFVSKKDSAQFIFIKDIVCFTAEGEYSNIHVRGCKYLFRRTLKSWEDSLPQNDFLRIHRSTIININKIMKLVKTDSRTYKVYMHDIVEPLDISQRFLSKIKLKLVH